MRKICVITGTRAEFGLLSGLMRKIRESGRTQLQVIATNMHLSPRYGNTYQEIEKDGFTIDRKIPILDDGKDDADATLAAMAKALSGFAAAFSELAPDLVVVLGDRYEILSAATAALIKGIPIAHIHGGEVTEGAYDDAIRHSITKMSSLHFTATEAYRKRVIQLGEQPDRVFCVGAPGVENIRTIPLMDQAEIEESIGFRLDDHTILVTYHPATLGSHTAAQDIRAFIDALDRRKDLRVVFTLPNSDTGSRDIADAIQAFVARNGDRAIACKSLGVRRYLSVMKNVAAVVGNSSSGLLEAPSLGIPTLDIGDRQKGRIAADSVLHCETDTESILEGLDRVLCPASREKASRVVNPYEKAGTTQAIFDVISRCPLDGLKQKHFYDLP
ncbi:MAG: UDP-N-acetylglucosamine 2-epimerase (hydrolyzing) [Bacteroidales bacterium]|nr:UDP-N-acetylglucosamine 2-epimerase (hydrolyzing) [Bacteroidales bacterium]